MNIALFTSVYFNNIGNGFIDIGAEEEIREAMPSDFDFVKISQCANFAASMSKLFAFKENPAVNWCWSRMKQIFPNSIHDRSYNTVSTLDVLSPAKMFKLDYLIIPGCVLTVPFFTIYGKLLEDKVQEGTKLIFLGVSGNNYTKYETEYVSNYLRRLMPYALITRDSVAYNAYNKYAAGGGCLQWHR